MPNSATWKSVISPAWSESDTKKCRCSKLHRWKCATDSAFLGQHHTHAQFQPGNFPSTLLCQLSDEQSAMADVKLEAQRRSELWFFHRDGSTGGQHGAWPPLTSGDWSMCDSQAVTQLGVPAWILHTYPTKILGPTEFSCAKVAKNSDSAYVHTPFKNCSSSNTQFCMGSV